MSWFRGVNPSAQQDLSLYISCSRGSFALNCLVTGWYSVTYCWFKIIYPPVIQNTKSPYAIPICGHPYNLFWNRISYPWLLRLFWKVNPSLAGLVTFFAFPKVGYPKRIATFRSKMAFWTFFDQLRDIPWYSHDIPHFLRIHIELVPLRRRLGDGTSCPGRRSCQDSDDFCGWFGDPLQT